MKRKIVIDEWRGCYPSNWKGVIVPEAMSHPAKYSSKLIRRIYEHMFEQGWVSAGDRILDPFGGVALGALDAMRLGLNYTGIELEEKFWKLGNANIDRWNTQYCSMPNWGTARLLHGDSRRLLSVISEQVQIAVSSPPYADSDQDYKGGWKRFHDGHTPLHTNDIQREAQYGTTDGQLSAMPAHQFDAAISSPPYAESLHQTTDGIDWTKGKDGRDFTKEPGQAIRLHMGKDYGETPGQLGGMKNAGFDVAVSSPPFLQSEGGTPEPKPNGTINAALYARHSAGNAKANGYGESEGQLSSMRDGGFDAALSSPPYAEARIGQESGQEHCGHGDQYGESSGQLGSMPAEGFDAAVSSPPFENGTAHDWRPCRETEEYQNKYGHVPVGNYGATDGNIGNDSGQDFWLAARAIVEQVYQALTPGGHSVWVVKNYVKSKQIVNFCDQWRQLCEAVGFVTLHEHHAMLVHHKGTQHLLEGGSVERKTESKSFFRRLAEKKGSPRIDYETVFCMEKPIV